MLTSEVAGAMASVMKLPQVNGKRHGQAAVISGKVIKKVIS